MPRLRGDRHRATLGAIKGRGTIEAGCYCAVVALQLDGPPRGLVHCHCGQCRRLSGGTFTTWASFRKTGLRVSSGDDAISAFAVTRNVTRHFCRHCGAHVFTLDVRQPQIVGVPAGALGDSACGFTPAAHYFVDHQAAWFTMKGDVAPFSLGTGSAR